MDDIGMSNSTTVVVKKLKELQWIPDTSTGVLMNKDCILIQNYTGKTYTYRAINFITGDNKYLFHRKKPVGKEDYKKINTKFMSLPFFNKNYPKNGVEMIDYIFAVIFPMYGYTVRREQVNLSKHMFKAMREEKISMSDIAVGLGKTHAYLVAAIVHNIFIIKGFITRKMPIIISTSSIELQRAMVKDYIPEISKILYENGIISKPITCVLRKGKENYLCENRLKDYFNTLNPNKKRKGEYSALEELVNNIEIDLDEVKGISNYDKRKICVNRGICFNCKKYRSCSYQNFMIRAKKSNYDFQICNHNYYLADILRRRKGLIPLFPEYKAVIIDEAHKLTGAAQQMYGTLMKQNEINSLLKKAKPKKAKGKVRKNISKICKETISYNNLLFKELIHHIPKGLYLEDTERFETIMTSRAKVLMKKIVTKLEELLRVIPEKDRKLLSDIRRIKEEIHTIMECNIIYWIEKPNAKGQTILASVPKALSQEMSKDIWCLDRAMLLTSGTISVDGNFDYMKKELGLDYINKSKIIEISKSSPFNFKENCIIYIADNIPYPNNDNDKYIKRIAEEIYKLIRASNGHALVLFTSYKPLRKVYKILSEQIKDIPLIEMSRGKKNAVLEFKKSEKGVLFATGSLWEGVNIPGDILSHLIIVKLPFPIPDPISEYEKTLYDDINDYKEAVLIPKMLIKLRQGVGRLIRNETDTGVISVLDVRASRRGKYHKAVIDALPKCKVIEKIGEVEKFIREKKDKTFFK